MALVAAMMLAGCATQAALEPATLIGITMEEVETQLGGRGDLTQLTQDVSVAVGREPAFTGADLGSSRWTVVAACADGPNVNEAKVLELAVIPTDTFTASVAEQVSAGDFDDTVSCIFGDQ